MQNKILIIIFLFFSCKPELKVIQAEKKIKTHINCQNEKYMIENSDNNLELSFDTILTTRDYWRKINHNQKINYKIIPYVKIKLDSPTLFESLNINLVGYSLWKPDLRLKTVINNNYVDSLRIINFFSKVSNNPDTSETRYKPEIFISYNKDTIITISESLKKLTFYYIEFQKANSKRIFNLELCKLQTK